MKASTLFILNFVVAVSFYSQTNAQNVLVPNTDAGLFQGSDKGDAFDSWSSTHERMKALWEPNSKQAQKMYNRAEDSAQKSYPLDIVMKGLFADYNEWSSKEMAKIADRIKAENRLNLQIQIPSGLNPYMTALVQSQMLDELKSSEAELKRLPRNFGKTNYIFAPTASMIVKADALMKEQFAPYGAAISSLPTPGNSSTTSVTIPGRNTKFTLQLDDSSERMRLFRMFLNQPNLGREMRMGKKGPEMVFTFQRRTEIDTPSGFYVKNKGDTEVFKFKNTEEARQFVAFTKEADAANASREWTEFDYAAGTMRVATPSLQREPIVSQVILNSNAENSESLAMVTPEGAFQIGANGNAFTKPALEAAPFVVVTDLNNIVEISDVLRSPINRTPEVPAVPAPKPENEEEILRRMRQGMLLPKSFDLHPLQCPRDVLI